MTITPKDVATLTILAVCPARHKDILSNLKGNALKIGKYIIKPSKSKSIHNNAAQSILDWTANNKRNAI